MGIEELINTRENKKVEESHDIKRGIDRLNFDEPNKKPWAEKVTKNLPESFWKEMFDKALRGWEEDTLFGLEEHLAKQNMDEETKEKFKKTMSQNIKTIVKNELLSIFKNTLDRQNLDVTEIQALLVDSIAPIGNDDLGEEIDNRKKMISTGLELGIAQSEPGELLPNEKLKAFIENTSPLFFEKKQEQETDEDLSNYRAILLKSYAAVGDAFSKSLPRGGTNYPERVVDAMTNTSFGLEEVYANKLPSEIVEKNEDLPSEESINQRKSEIRTEIANYFG